MKACRLAMSGIVVIGVLLVPWNVYAITARGLNRIGGVAGGVIAGFLTNDGGTQILTNDGGTQRLTPG